MADGSDALLASTEAVAAPPPGLPDGYRAVVIGATGAIGRELVAELVVSPKCGSVVAVTRRKLGDATSGPFPPEHVADSFPALGAGGRHEGTAATKLEIAVVDWESVCNAAGDGTHDSLCAGAHFVACCLGTTKGDAGSKAAFARCDLDYTTAAAQLAKRGGCTQYTLVTSKGASSSSCIFYIKIKGQQEDVAKELGFSRLTIWQPGALDRGELRSQRASERCMGCLGMRGIDVKLVARAICVDAEQLSAASSGAATAVFGDDDIRAIAATSH
jgi:oxidoreductase